MYPIEIKDAWNPYFVLIESHGTACLSGTKYIHAIDIHTHTHTILQQCLRRTLCHFREIFLSFTIRVDFLSTATVFSLYVVKYCVKI